MENLNAEAVKKALECCTTGLGECCAECPNYNAGKDLTYDGCMEMVMRQGLDLIKSQEQRIDELWKIAEFYRKEAERNAARLTVEGGDGIQDN